MISKNYISVSCSMSMGQNYQTEISHIPLTVIVHSCESYYDRKLKQLKHTLAGQIVIVKNGHLVYKDLPYPDTLQKIQEHFTSLTSGDIERIKQVITPYVWTQKQAENAASILTTLYDTYQAKPIYGTVRANTGVATEIWKINSNVVQQENKLAKDVTYFLRLMYRTTSNHENSQNDDIGIYTETSLLTLLKNKYDIFNKKEQSIYTLSEYSIQSIIYTEDIYFYFTHPNLRLKAMDKIVEKSSAFSDKAWPSPLSLPFCGFHNEMQSARSNKFDKIIITKNNNKLTLTLDNVKYDGDVLSRIPPYSLFHNWDTKKFASASFLFTKSKKSPQMFFQKDLLIAITMLVSGNVEFIDRGFQDQHVLYDVKTNEWVMRKKQGKGGRSRFKCQRPNMFETLYSLAQGKNLIEVRSNDV